MFVGGFLLLAAVITWAVALLISPHTAPTVEGTEQVRTTVVVFLRNSAIGTLFLTAIAAWLLFPTRRPRWPARDWALISLIAVLVASSIYQLVWLQTSVVN
jgi:drug/metabolite transporter (DMT)-like permease